MGGKDSEFSLGTNTQQRRILILFVYSSFPFGIRCHMYFSMEFVNSLGEIIPLKFSHEFRPLNDFRIFEGKEFLGMHGKSFLIF